MKGGRLWLILVRESRIFQKKWFTNFKLGFSI